MNLLESLIFIFLTAGLVFFLIPILVARIDTQRSVQHRQIETAITRQNLIINAQSKLLEDLTRLFWEYQLILVAVPYYQQFHKPDLFHQALSTYNEQAGHILGEIRAEISKAKRLTPDHTFQELNQLYYDQLIPMDLQVSHLAALESAQGNAQTEWDKLYRLVVEELSEIIDNMMDKLAGEIKLKA